MEILCNIIIILMVCMIIFSIINSFIIVRKMWLKNKNIQPPILVSAFFILIIVHFVIDDPWK